MKDRCTCTYPAAEHGAFAGEKIVDVSECVVLSITGQDTDVIKLHMAARERRNKDPGKKGYG